MNRHYRLYDEACTVDSLDQQGQPDLFVKEAPLSPYDQFPYFAERRTQETIIQIRIFKNKHPKIVQAEQLLYAFLDQRWGRRVGYEVYCDNVKFNATQRPATACP